MSATRRNSSAIRQDGGMITLEWVLMIGAVVVPIALAAYQILRALSDFYAFNSWNIGLPFP